MHTRRIFSYMPCSIGINGRREWSTRLLWEVCWDFRMMAAWRSVETRTTVWLEFVCAFGILSQRSSPNASWVNRLEGDRLSAVLCV